MCSEKMEYVTQPGHIKSKIWFSKKDEDLEFTQ